MNGRHVLCATALCGEPAVRLVSCEGEGSYPYCRGCSESLLGAGEEIDRGPILTASIAPTKDSRLRMARYRKLREFESLEPGWDSYDARPITPDALRAARTLLDGIERAQVVPCPDGGVQIEWHLKGVDAEITFDPNGEQER